MSSVTADAHEAYARDGYFIQPKSLFARPKVEAARAGMDAIRSGKYDRNTDKLPYAYEAPEVEPHALNRISQPQFVNKAIFDLVTEPVLGELAAKVTGASRVQIFSITAFYKPSNAEGSAKGIVGWHTDRLYWNSIWPNGGVFTIWIALSDVTADAGPLRFVRGSHTWGSFDEGDFFDERDLGELRNGITVPAGKRWEEVHAILPPGGLTVHDWETYHGSGPNTSGRPRCSLSVHLLTQAAHLSENISEDFKSYAPLDRLDLCPVIY